MKTIKFKEIPFSVYFAFTILATILIFITLNTIGLSLSIKNLEEKAARTPLRAEEVEELYNDFLHARTYLSISVDHDDIAAVEEEFCEIRGALAIGDTESAAIAKSRLCGALGHLRRLSGFNIDSII